MATLNAKKANVASFAPYGHIIEPREDGLQYDDKDAELDLSKGKPRLYQMKLNQRGLRFRKITYHENVTQCLGANGEGPWYLAVSKAGGKAPTMGEIECFEIGGSQCVKLHKGTWHAGPLFEGEEMSFYNLELSDTNERDQTSLVFEDELSVVPLRLQ